MLCVIHVLIEESPQLVWVSLDQKCKKKKKKSHTDQCLYQYPIVACVHLAPVGKCLREIYPILLLQ